MSHFWILKNLPQNEPGCESCSTPEDRWDEVLLWHERCDTVVSARGELLLFSPRSVSPRVPLKWCRGHTCGTGCAHIYLIGSQAAVFDLFFLLSSAFSPFLFTLLLPPPSPCLQAKAEQDFWSPLPCPDFKSWEGLASVLQVLLCICLNSFLPLTCLPLSSCSHIGGSL